MQYPALPQLTAVLLAASLSGAAQAALVDRGGGLIYDTDLDVTWLADANYAQTSGYDADGLMTWSQATTWAANLVYHDSVRNVDYSDWRLPTTTDTGAPGCNLAYSGTDCGWNVDPASSEMAHLFFTELGDKSYYDTAGNPQPGYGLVNKGPFTNFQHSVYWSSTEDTLNTTAALFFDTDRGVQFYRGKTDDGYELAVRPGDVATVSEAQTYALMLAGLGLVGWRARRRAGGARRADAADSFSFIVRR